MVKSKVIAVDFDGTLFEEDYPNIGKPIQKNIDGIKRLISQGHRIVLNTCRTGKSLQEAVHACLELGIIFTAINEQDPIEKCLWTSESSTKPYAHYYLDDHNVSCIEELEEKINKSEK